MFEIKKIIEIINRDGFLYTAKRSLAYVISHTPLAYNMSFSYTKGTRLIFSPALLTYSIFAKRDTRHEDIDIIKKYTPVGGIVFDVGGNIGSLAIPAAEHVGKDGRVHIFEPSPKFFKIITYNITVNQFSDRITAHQVALGPKAGTVYLNEGVADDTTNYIDTKGTAVKQDTLDSFTKSFSHIDFLKIDVEGYELEVLKGAIDTLKKAAVLYIEFIPSQLERCGSDPNEVLSIISEQFTTYHIKNGILNPFKYNPTSIHCSDLLCIKK